MSLHVSRLSFFVRAGMRKWIKAHFRCDSIYYISNWWLHWIAKKGKRSGVNLTATPWDYCEKHIIASLIDSQEINDFNDIRLLEIIPTWGRYYYFRKQRNMILSYQESNGYLLISLHNDIIVSSHHTLFGTNFQIWREKL